MFTTRLGESAKCIASVSVSHFPSLSYTDFTLAGIECVLGGGRATPYHVYIYEILLGVFGI